MYENRSSFLFCPAEEDTLYTMRCLQADREKGCLSSLEERQLSCMENRVSEGTVYLIPAIVFAAACQENSKAWLDSFSPSQKREWYDNGLTWLRRCPSFLEKFGWRSRRSAILAAGLLSCGEDARTANGPEMNQVRTMLMEGWGFLWDRLCKLDDLSAADWEDMLSPWRDGGQMRNGMAGVLLLMAQLQKKQVLDRDQLWRSFKRLKAFSQECLKPSGLWNEELPAWRTEDDMEWLLLHFRNPQRPAYIREKGRLSSEWLERLYRIMELAGLPASVCEEIWLSPGEVHRLLEVMEDKKTEKQYMTFLMLYAVSRELAAAGKLAAAADMQIR